MFSRVSFFSVGILVVVFCGLLAAGCDNTVLTDDISKPSTPATKPPTPATKPPIPATNPPIPATNPSTSATNPSIPATKPPIPATKPPDPPPPPPVPEFPTWYVSEDGDDRLLGTEPVLALASIREALQSITEAYKGESWNLGDSAVIVISGTITEPGTEENMVTIDGLDKYPPLILKGDLERAGKLDANRSSSHPGRVLYIECNNVTLGENLMLTGGYAESGGGVLVGRRGTLTINGVMIRDNTSRNGGGVMVDNGTVTMTEGSISRNDNNYDKNPGTGGGVYVDRDGYFTLSGGEIAANGYDDTTANGGGVFINNGGTFVMKGGVIFANEAKCFGDGVCIRPFGLFNMFDGDISNDVVVKGSGAFNTFGGDVKSTTEISEAVRLPYTDDQ